MTPADNDLSRTRNSAEGRRVLVVEDEFFIADDIAGLIRAAGAEVIGPAPTLEQALSLAGSAPADFAILDINLRGQKVFPAADILASRGVPFVFASGYDAHTIPPRFSHVPCWEKPVDRDVLNRALKD